MLAKANLPIKARHHPGNKIWALLNEVHSDMEPKKFRLKLHKMISLKGLKKMRKESWRLKITIRMERYKINRKLLSKYGLKGS